MKRVFCIGLFFCTFFFISSLHALEELKLIIVRHAQSENNVEGFFNSNPQHPNYSPANLTLTGRKQAQEKAQDLKDQGINQHTVSICLVSPLPRARQTAEILAQNGVFSREKMVIEPRLIEVQMGEKEGLPHSAFPAKEKSDHSRGNIYGGETEVEVRMRVEQLLQELQKKPRGGHVILVTHGTPAQELHRLITGRPRKIKNAESIIFPLNLK